MNLRSPLSKAKGLGSAKSGLHHWWLQKITAISLIPLVTWFVYSVVLTAKDGGNILPLISSPVNAIALILLIGIALFHGTLGVQVIIEDYITGKLTKLFLLLFCKIGSGFIGAAAILAIIYAHINGVDDYKPEYNKLASPTDNKSVVISIENENIKDKVN